MSERGWTYLVEQPHPWRRQLCIKGRKLLAANVWRDMASNGLSREEAADNWDLPPEAVDEVVRYCESHQELIAREADEERARLEAAGVRLD